MSYFQHDCLSFLVSPGTSHFLYLRTYVLILRASRKQLTIPDDRLVRILGLEWPKRETESCLKESRGAENNAHCLKQKCCHYQ